MSVYEPALRADERDNLKVMLLIAAALHCGSCGKSLDSRIANLGQKEKQNA
jgi:hypothetical protein